MAIDFGRMARGVATGYLSAKIANTEANDYDPSVKTLHLSVCLPKALWQVNCGR